jgi:hypothetical protein
MIDRVPQPVCGNDKQISRPLPGVNIRKSNRQPSRRVASITPTYRLRQCTQALVRGNGERLSSRGIVPIVQQVTGRDSSVGIAPHYGLDGPGIECRWGTTFSAPVKTGPGTHPASYTMGTGSFLEVQWLGRGADPPPSDKVKERIELYHCSTFGPSWPVLR